MKNTITQVYNDMSVIDKIVTLALLSTFYTSYIGLFWVSALIIAVGIAIGMASTMQKDTNPTRQSWEVTGKNSDGSAVIVEV